jgi:hypothetical protein
MGGGRKRSNRAEQNKDKSFARQTAKNNKIKLTQSENYVCETKLVKLFKCILTVCPINEL